MLSAGGDHRAVSHKVNALIRHRYEKECLQ